jgi:hypothetical protein
MPHFSPPPAEAEQFTGEESVAAVAGLVLKYRPRTSYTFSPALRTLRFYDNSRELKLKMQDWVAVVGGNVVVLPPSLMEGSTTSESD